MSAPDPPPRADERPPLAEIIADGIPVDWAREASTGKFDLEEIQRFQSVEKVCRAHRRLFEQAQESLTWGLENDTKPMSPADSAKPEPIWGHLHIREQVGKGGFGEVYRAFDSVLERDVALKLMKAKGHAPEDALRTFLHEARRLARVRHDNVVIVHGADVRDGRMGMWTDFLHGTTLEELLRIQGPLSARETSLIGIDLCRALAAVHGAGIIHRDVKASNVMRTEGGRIVLFDFGMAIADPRATGGSQDPMGGTPFYMAPEVLQGGRPDPSADLYSLGVLLFRLASARYPIEVSGIKEIQEAHRLGRRTSLRSLRPDLPTEFVRIVEKAIAPLPEDRYPNAGSLEKDLAAFVAAQSHMRPWYLRPLPLIAGGTTAAVLVGALIVVSMVAPTFSVGASLYKNGDTEILSGDRVIPGDRITLRLHPSRNARVVVLNRDSQGHLQRVFPESGSAVAAVLAGDRDYQVPAQTDQLERFWTIEGTGGRESFVILSAGVARWWPWKQPSFPKELETAMSSIPTAEENESLASASPDSAASEPAGRPRAKPESRLRSTGSESQLEALVQQAEAAHKVHVQRFDLHVGGN